MEKIPATLTVLTRNSAETLGRALESAKAFTEIILCDGHSTDRTREIAAIYHAKVIDQAPEHLDADGRLIDFAGARNQLLAAATHPWVFALDSDEQLTPALIEEMRGIVQTNQPAAYFVPRRYVWRGHEIRYATTYPNKQLRFFHRAAVQHYTRRVHEKPVVSAGMPTHTLAEYMLVPLGDLHELRTRWLKYIEIEGTLQPSLSLKKWLLINLRQLKTSLVYLARLPGVLIRPRSTRLPVLYELARHEYHLRLAWRLFKNIRLGRATH